MIVIPENAVFRPIHNDGLAWPNSIYSTRIERVDRFRYWWRNGGHCGCFKLLHSGWLTGAHHAEQPSKRDQGTHSHLGCGTRQTARMVPATQRAWLAHLGATQNGCSHSHTPVHNSSETTATSDAKQRNHTAQTNTGAKLCRLQRECGANGIIIHLRQPNDNPSTPFGKVSSGGTENRAPYSTQHIGNDNVLQTK